MNSTNKSSLLVGIMEVNFSDEYFLLAKNQWRINLLSAEQTLLRVYDETHELCFVTRFENESLTYYFLFGTYEHSDGKLFHNVIFDVNLAESAFKDKSSDDIFELVRQAFGERKSVLLQESGGYHE